MLHGYHAHVYYGPTQQPIAERIRDRLALNFPVQIGQNQGLAGPHPIPQVQIIFKPEAFAEVVPWLMLNREGLDILVHPLTDDEYDDHTANALWLGKPVDLKLEILPHAPYPPYLLPA